MDTNLAKKSSDCVQENSSTSNHEITNKLKEVLKASHINDPVSEILLKDSCLQGEGNGSQTHYVTIKFASLEKVPLNLFMKRELENLIRQEINRECKMFEKESTFFMDYLPLARQLCQKMGHENLMDIYPKCYYGDAKLVVLENLVVDKSYFILNKEEMQDFDAAKIALISLAKHHAISHALVQNMGGTQIFLEKFPVFGFEMYKTKIAEKMLPSMFEDAVDINLNILEKSNQEGKNEAIEILKACQGKIFLKMLESFNTNSDDDFRVLNHGDYWNNNMLFLKDKTSGKLTGHKAIDFQVLRYCSSGVDLGYFLFTSVKPEVRQSRLHDLLLVYFETLKETTFDLGYAINLSYEQLLNDFRNTFGYGYFWGLTVATGAGYAVLKDMNPNETDIENGTNAFTQLVTKWIANNPEKSTKIAELLVGVVKEYQCLTL